MNRQISATGKGLITAFLMLVAAVLSFYVLKLPVTGTNQLIPLVIFLGGICWSLFSFKKTTGAATGLKIYFTEGFKTFIVVTLVMALYTFIFYKLNPQILENALKDNEVLALKQGNHTPGEIKTNSEKLRDIFMPMMLTINIAKYLLLGALATLLLSAFLSQKKLKHA